MKKTNFWVDAALLIGFLAAMNPPLTGIPIHEWLSLALAATVVAHLLFHWKWITTVGFQFFRRLFHSSRLKFVVDVLLFIAFTLVMTSGIMISRSVLTALGIRLVANSSWRVLHAASADAALWLAALHFALNWKWLAEMTKRVLLTPFGGLWRKIKPRPAPVTLDINEQ